MGLQECISYAIIVIKLKASYNILYGKNYDNLRTAAKCLNPCIFNGLQVFDSCLTVKDGIVCHSSPSCTPYMRHIIPLIGRKGKGRPQ